MTTMATLSFLCAKCHQEFDADVGEITFPRPRWRHWFAGGNGRPAFERPVTCPSCGVLKPGSEAIITEAGQSQLTELFFEDADRRDGGGQSRRARTNNDEVIGEILVGLCLSLWFLLFR